MSHFTVLVIGDNPEEQLAPFNEQPEEGSPYLEFNDCSEEVDNEWEGTSERVKMPDGRLLRLWDEEFRVEGSFGLGTDSHQIPEHLEKVQVPNSELYESKADFVEKYYGYEERNGTFGYMANSDAKWDWYQLGGRWNGYFRLKELKLLEVTDMSPVFNRLGFSANEMQTMISMFKNNFERFKVKVLGKYGLATAMEIEAEVRKLASTIYPKATLGSPGVFGSQIDETDASLADQALVGQIDWELMRAERKEAAEQRWTKAGYSQNSLSKENYFAGFRAEESFDDFIARHDCVATYAVLKDGVWYASGEMGWFGMSSNEKSDYDWSAQFQAALEGLPEDTLVSIYDCHI